jgi:conjugal transfer pilus assembly protein TraV
MRILFASYKDDQGNLNLPGYLYVQVEPETWAFGEASNLRPQRVIPAQMIQKSTQQAGDQEYRQQGVSPLEYIEK